MKKVKIISNPSSGRQGFEKRLDHLCKLLLDDGYTLNKFLTEKKDDAMLETMRACQEGWDMIIVSGGDGTVNEVATGIANSNNKIPVAILATGTVNDFASHLNIPKNIDDFYHMIKKENIVSVDLGKTNDNYFVNVAAGGFLTNVGYQVQPEAKAILGRMAYYLEGLREFALQGFEPITVEFNSKEYTRTEEILLFIISNSSSIGGFKNLAPRADVSDGYLDVIIIRKSEVQDLANIFFSILRGEHITHPNVGYFKTKHIEINTKDHVSIDIDGEYGGELPETFQIVSGGFKVFTL